MSEESSTTWYNVAFSISDIIRQTEKASLIECTKGEYKGYRLWIPRKLVKSIDRDEQMFCFSFSENFNFELVEINDENKIIDEVSLSAEELFKQFEPAKLPKKASSYSNSGSSKGKKAQSSKAKEQEYDDEEDNTSSLVDDDE